MPRRSRLEVPGTALHITQRGVNRGAIFVDDEDRRHFLLLVEQSARENDVAVHAYVLMGNHVHLLVSAAAPGAISQAMRQTGHCYVQSFNRRHRRSGTLWQGRYKSCLVDDDRYLLCAYRYIELNPVRARMVESPERYRWSSVHANLALLIDPLVTPHPCFLAIAADAQARAAAYRQLLKEGVNEDDLASIRIHVQQGKAWGDHRFQSMVAKTLGRAAHCRPIGRPRTKALD